MSVNTKLGSPAAVNSKQTIRQSLKQSNSQSIKQSLYPHPLLDRLHGQVTALFALTVILVSSLCINACQTIISLCVFIPSFYRLSVNQWMANTWWLLLAWGVEVWSAVPYIVTGELPHANDIAILLGNHAPGIDFITGIIVSSLGGGPGSGRMMTLMKQSLRFVPTIGFMHYFQGSLFLARNWEKDQRAIVAKLDSMNNGEFPRPFWIGVYPEGTRITPEKRVQSQEFAQKRGLPLLEHVLLPRTKGFTFLMSKIGPTLTAIYDATCAYSKSALLLTDILMYGRFRCEGCYIDLHRTDAKTVSNLPVEEQEQWIMKQWQRKDALLQMFQDTGRFDPSMTPHQLPQDRYMKLSAIFGGWALIVSALISYLCRSWSVAVFLLVMVFLTQLRGVMLDGDRLFGIRFNKQNQKKSR